MNKIFSNKRVQGTARTTPPLTRSVISKEKKLKLQLRAFAVGLLIYFVMNQVKVIIYTTLALHYSVNFENLWIKIFSIIISIILLVSPSYIAGWMSNDKGTLLGFSVPFVACNLLMVSVLFMTNSQFTGATLIYKWIEKTSLPSIVGAVSGAAGQLHKTAYNLSLKRDREKR
jgi:hypothetical protein